MKKIIKFKRNTDGQSLVEFALVLPILLLLILVMVELGWLLNGKITLTSAAREGARAAIIYESETEALTEAQKEKKAYDAAQGAVDKSVEGSSLIKNTAKVKTPVLKDGNAIVIVTADINPIVGMKPILELFLPSADYDDGVITLTAKAEMRIEK